MSVTKYLTLNFIVRLTLYCPEAFSQSEIIQRKLEIVENISGLLDTERG